MNLRIDFFEVVATIKRWEDKILGKLPFKTLLTICVIVISWQFVMAKSTLSSIESDVKEIKEEIDVSSLGSLGGSIGSDVSDMKGDISSIRSDISSIENDISLIKR